jgi:hypothetical protein
LWIRVVTHAATKTLASLGEGRIFGGGMAFRRDLTGASIILATIAVLLHWTIVVVGRQRFVLIFVAAAALAFPSAVGAAVFNQQDIKRLTEIDAAILSLEQEINASLKSFPYFEGERISLYAILELNLEAARERLFTITMLVAGSFAMETPADQARNLNILYSHILPPTRAYLNAKKKAIIEIARAASSDDLFVSYSSRATIVLGDRALPVVEELYRRLAALHK